MRYALATLMIAIATTVGAAEVRLAPEDRTSLTLTIYSDGLALVLDRREAKLDKGVNSLAYEGISPRTIPASAAVCTEGSLRVLETTYDLDRLTSEALLRRSVGRTVGVVRTHPTTGEETVEDAMLLSVEGGAVLRYRDRIEIGEPGRLVFKHIPESLRTDPALIAVVDSPESRTHEVELSYLTEGMTWSADYLIELDEAKGRLDIVGRATLTNESGIHFQNASFGLIAGSLQHVSAEPPQRSRAEAMAVTAGAQPTPRRESIGDRHLYKIDRLTTLQDRETKQVSLLSAHDVLVDRGYESESAVSAFGREARELRPTHPHIRFRFDNSERMGLGIPLPSGVVRLYERDPTGMLRLLGEDQLADTPAGRTVELSPGQAFDITVVRRQTAFERTGLPENVFDSAWSIEVSNAKDQAIPIKLVEIVPGDWQILAESAPHEKEAANRAVWRLMVPAHGSAELTYRVRVTQ